MNTFNFAVKFNLYKGCIGSGCPYKNHKASVNECLQKNKSARVCFGHPVILLDTQLTERLKGAKSVVGIGGIYDIPSILYMLI